MNSPLRMNFLLRAVTTMATLGSLTSAGWAARSHKGKPPGTFPAHLPKPIARQAMRNPENWELLCDYGAMYVARGVRLPPRLVFRSAAETARWQAQIPQTSRRWNGLQVTLQPAAMAALAAARARARRAGMRLDPRGPDASRRDYEQTSRLWESRVRPALRYWRRRGRISRREAVHIRELSPSEQVPLVLRLERRGIWFSTYFNKSILDSVAAPGSSQHLAMLAFDLREYSNPRLWPLLAAAGWFQTIPTDLPHFTYLGWPQGQLPSLGLRRLRVQGHVFWIPDLPARRPQNRFRH